MKMHTSGTVILWGTLAGVSALAWQLGGMIDHSTAQLLLGFLFGAFVGIPIVLIALAAPQQRRVDVYHHVERETPVQPQKPPLQIAAQPTRYIVVGKPASQLPTAQRARIEVRR